MTSGRQRFQNDELVLAVSQSVDREIWDEGRYEAFFEELCRSREYQKDALRTTLRYLLGQQYADLAHLAQENMASNDALVRAYGSWPGLSRRLQFPNQLSASLDIATGAGKSFVIYGIAAVMLAEGAVDQVLVLCPSTTIERGLLAKFRELAADPVLRQTMPADRPAPSVIDASVSITAGSICVENYHAVLERTGSSVRQSLAGKGARTLVINDEAHHVANQSDADSKKWKDFLQDEAFGFHYIIGLSGTCYVGNDYFPDVIFRFSLRQAIEQRYVKRVDYVAEVPTSDDPEEKWQLVLNRHRETTRRLHPRSIRPLTIIVTHTIAACIDVADELKDFLVESSFCSADDADRRVLAVYNGAPSAVELDAVDTVESPVEFIVSVSMLNEGWDVKRVFQIVPHEERAFSSRLLIAQVLGRGLRVPENWAGDQPTVTVFNHDAWAPRIRNLVSEILEIDKRLTSRVDESCPYNFALHQIDYTLEPVAEESPVPERRSLFPLGYVDVPSDAPDEDVTVIFERAGTGATHRWQTTVHHKSYTPAEVAEVMRERLEESLVPDDGSEPSAQEAALLNEWSADRLEAVVLASLMRVGADVATDRMRQRFLQALGVLRQRPAAVVRYRPVEERFRELLTARRPSDSVGAQELRHNKTCFVTQNTRGHLGDEQVALFDEVSEPGSGYKVVPIQNALDFKTSLILAIADSENERRFMNALVDRANVGAYRAWIKNTAARFYEIDFAWRRGGYLRRAKFSPDFFIRTEDMTLVIEIKDDEEIREVSEENRRKAEFATEHFRRINHELSERGVDVMYRFNFLTPRNYNGFFQALRSNRAEAFRSELDVALAADQ